MTAAAPPVEEGVVGLIGTPAAWVCAAVWGLFLAAAASWLEGSPRVWGRRGAPPVSVSLLDGALRHAAYCVVSLAMYCTVEVVRPIGVSPVSNTFDATGDSSADNATEPYYGLGSGSTVVHLALIVVATLAPAAAHFATLPPLLRLRPTAAAAEGAASADGAGGGGGAHEVVWRLRWLRGPAAPGGGGVEHHPDAVLPSHPPEPFRVGGGGGDLQMSALLALSDAHLQGARELVLGAVAARNSGVGGVALRPPASRPPAYAAEDDSPHVLLLRQPRVPRVPLPAGVEAAAAAAATTAFFSEACRGEGARPEVLRAESEAAADAAAAAAGGEGGGDDASLFVAWAAVHEAVLGWMAGGARSELDATVTALLDDGGGGHGVRLRALFASGVASASASAHAAAERVLHALLPAALAGRGGDAAAAAVFRHLCFRKHPDVRVLVHGTPAAEMTEAILLSYVRHAVAAPLPPPGTTRELWEKAAAAEEAAAAAAGSSSSTFAEELMGSVSVDGGAGDGYASRRESVLLAVRVEEDFVDVLLNGTGAPTLDDAPCEAADVLASAPPSSSGGGGGGGGGGGDAATTLSTFAPEWHDAATSRPLSLAPSAGTEYRQGRGAWYASRSLLRSLAPPPPAAAAAAAAQHRRQHRHGQHRHGRHRRLSAATAAAAEAAATARLEAFKVLATASAEAAAAAVAHPTHLLAMFAVSYRRAGRRRDAVATVEVCEDECAFDAAAAATGGSSFAWDVELSGLGKTLAAAAGGLPPSPGGGGGRRAFPHAGQWESLFVTAGRYRGYYIAGVRRGVGGSSGRRVFALERARGVVAVAATAAVGAVARCVAAAATGGGGGRVVGVDLAGLSLGEAEAVTTTATTAAEESLLRAAVTLQRCRAWEGAAADGVVPHRGPGASGLYLVEFTVDDAFAPFPLGVLGGAGGGGGGGYCAGLCGGGGGGGQGLPRRSSFKAFAARGGDNDSGDDGSGSEEAGREVGRAGIGGGGCGCETLVVHVEYGGAGVLQTGSAFFPYSSITAAYEGVAAAQKRRQQRLRHSASASPGAGVGAVHVWVAGALQEAAAGAAHPPVVIRDLRAAGIDAGSTRSPLLLVRFLPGCLIAADVVVEASNVVVHGLSLTGSLRVAAGAEHVTVSNLFSVAASGGGGGGGNILAAIPDPWGSRIFLRKLFCARGSGLGWDRAAAAGRHAAASSPPPPPITVTADDSSFASSSSDGSAAPTTTPPLGNPLVAYHAGSGGIRDDGWEGETEVLWREAAHLLTELPDVCFRVSCATARLAASIDLRGDDDKAVPDDEAAVAAAAAGGLLLSKAVPAPQACDAVVVRCMLVYAVAASFVWCLSVSAGVFAGQEGSFCEGRAAVAGSGPCMRGEALVATLVVTLAATLGLPLYAEGRVAVELFLYSPDQPQ